MSRLIPAAVLASCLGVPIPGPAQELHGFVDARYGLRTQSDPNSGQETLNELRLQLKGTWSHDLFTATARSDFLYDGIARRHDHINLETGAGPVDLRELNLLFTPAEFMDIKIGRQILTWGTGDLLFVNDLFPKDWQSFFSGRDEEYLKAPSDALLISLFSPFANLDIAYSPHFDADRFIDGERLSYWDGKRLTGARLRTDKPDEWLEDDEIALRVSRNLQGWESALYGYRGRWKTPRGFDPVTGRNTFPKLLVYGVSLRGPLAGGIANLEVGYYDSREDRSGVDPFVPNGQVRLLAGYEHEIITNLTGSMQYYLEHRLDHDEYRAAFPGAPGTEADENRHTLTMRLTRMLMNQNLTLGLFVYWSPSDRDGYLLPSAAYKLSDDWLLEARGNLFFGSHNHTFFGQLEDNSNLTFTARYSF
ncbi:MAG: hypothetical protein LGR52_04830 [Candidatus Thiosymbion ectosymbiont of Robbea hypermnestra]|nr:hypothetical protein [Candidatus Thiosymbion ectosymbiont of Robbea hypermnestra]